MKPEVITKQQGRPRVWNFDTMEVGGWQEIPCKQKDQEGKVKSARSLCVKHSENGKVFKASITRTGVMIEREK